MNALSIRKPHILQPLRTATTVVLFGIALLWPSLLLADTLMMAQAKTQTDTQADTQANTQAGAQAESQSNSDSRLEDLFDALSQTTNPGDAEVIALQIWERWITGNNDATNISMMRRGIQFMDSGNLSIAEEVFSRIILRDASYTEAWNKRATVRYLLNNLDGSEQDIYEVLTREPRHFGAMSGLGLIKMQQGKFNDALTIYEDILKIHPNSPDAVRMVPKLQGMLKGSPA